MKKENRNWKLIIGLILGLLMLLLWPIIAFGEEAQWELGFSGYSQETYNFSTDELNNDRTRLKFTLDSDESPCGLVVELEISEAQDSWNALESSSWLQKGWLECEPSKSLTVEVGYIFPVNDLSTFWPGDIITARYPSMYPWQGYGAWGINAKHSGDLWTHMLTVSGRSDLPFNHGQQFERMEVGTRSVWSVVEEASIAFSTQISEDFVHAGIDVSRSVGGTNIDAGVFWSDADNSPISAFVQTEWLLPRDFAFHVLFQEPVDGDETLTAGAGYRWNRFYFVGDYERNLDRGAGAVLLSTRYNW